MWEHFSNTDEDIESDDHSATPSQQSGGGESHIQLK
jgi:hypothetical protein